MKKIILSDEEYNTLIEELVSLLSYKWSDLSLPSEDCGTKTIEMIKDNTYNLEEEENQEYDPLYPCGPI